MSLHLSNRLLEPFKDKHGSFFGHSWHELLDLVLELLWCWCQVCFDLDRVQMEKTDISDAWQLSLEVLSVELEQVQGVLQSLNGIKQVNID